MLINLLKILLTSLPREIGVVLFQLDVHDFVKITPFQKWKIIRLLHEVNEHKHDCGPFERRELAFPHPITFVQPKNSSFQN